MTAEPSRRAVRRVQVYYGEALRTVRSSVYAEPRLSKRKRELRSKSDITTTGRDGGGSYESLDMNGDIGFKGLAFVRCPDDLCLPFRLVYW